MRALAWMLVLLLFIASPCSGAVVDYTIPSTQQQLVYDVDTDSWAPTCEPGTVPCHIKFIRIYMYQSTSTRPDKWEPIRDKYVEFREGQADTLILNEQGNYHVRGVNTSYAEGCPSSIIYVGSPTGIPITPHLYITETHYFNVQGRLVLDIDHVAHGYYWKVDKWNDGTKTKMKLRR